MGYTLLPFQFWGPPVATSSALPAVGTLGEVRLTIDTGFIYYWDSNSWEITGSGGFVPTSRNINTTAPLTGGGSLASDLTLAIPAATSGANGYLTSADWTTFNNKVATTRSIATTAPLTGGGDLSANRTFAMPVATALADGYLDADDWTTFNSKQPLITAGTTADYYRGDKTFVELNIAALTAVTSGAAAASGVIGQIVTASQAANTAAGVAATGDWGNAISVSIPAGRWLVWGTAGFNENSAVLTTSLSCGISASASGAGIGEFDTTVAAYTISGAADALFTTPHVPVNISGATTYYLNTRFYYTSGAPQHRGRITALRIG